MVHILPSLQSVPDNESADSAHELIISLPLLDSIVLILSQAPEDIQPQPVQVHLPQLCQPLLLLLLTLSIQPELLKDALPQFVYVHLAEVLRTSRFQGSVVSIDFQFSPEVCLDLRVVVLFNRLVLGLQV